MKKFAIDRVRLACALGPFPSEQYIASVILENNESFLAQRHPLYGPVVECSNEPRDMPLFGIYWVEV